MLETLRRRNEDLQRDIASMIQLASNATIPSELEPYRGVFLSHARDFLTKAQANLTLIGLGHDRLIPDILSETSTLIQRARLFKFRYLRALYRTLPWDRVSLRTIAWLHAQHQETRPYPAVFADDDVSVIPARSLPFYFFPCLEQRGLRFQPLLLHEFGHILYQCHKQEMDALVGDFQQAVELQLLPTSQRNDQYAEQQTRTRQSVVETWYKWAQEFFCDAVGLTIGGPCYLHAFSEYVGRLQSSDYSRLPGDLHGSRHPPSWLRVQVLAERAAATGFEETAKHVSENWRATATVLGVKEDHHGFFTESLKPELAHAIDDMLEEASPRKCTDREAAGLGWDSDPGESDCPVERRLATVLQGPAAVPPVGGAGASGALRPAGGARKRLREDTSHPHLARLSVNKRGSGFQTSSS